MPAYFDKLWKDAVENLFPSFLLFFAADLYKEIDLDRGYDFLDQELSQIALEAEEGRRYVDKLVKLYLLDGEEEWFLIHIEIQGYYEKDFPQRVFTYFYRIYDRFKRYPVSLVIFTDPRKGFKPDTHRIDRYGCELIFKYRAYKILEYNEEELEASTNPFALAVLAWKLALQAKNDASLLGFLDEEKIFSFKRKLIRLMFERGYGRNVIISLFRFIDGALYVTDASRKALIYRELSSLQEEKKMPYLSSIEREAMEKGFKDGKQQGIQQGIQQGMQQGMQQGIREGLLKAIELGLELRFGEEGLKIYPKIKKIEEIDILETITEAIMTGEKIEDIQKLYQEER